MSTGRRGNGQMPSQCPRPTPQEVRTKGLGGHAADANKHLATCCAQAPPVPSNLMGRGRCLNPYVSNGEPGRTSHDPPRRGRLSGVGCAFPAAGFMIVELCNAGQSKDVACWTTYTMHIMTHGLNCRYTNPASSGETCRYMQTSAVQTCTAWQLNLNNMVHNEY